MKQMFLYFYQIFDTGQKKRMLILFSMMIAGAVFETIHCNANSYSDR